MSKEATEHPREGKDHFTTSKEGYFGKVVSRQALCITLFAVLPAKPFQ